MLAVPFVFHLWPYLGTFRCIQTVGEHGPPSLKLSYDDPSVDVTIVDQ
jgi:hypothetical protein